MVVVVGRYCLSLVFSQPNTAQWVVRIRIDGDVTEEACRKLHGELRDTVLLGGIDGIRQARVIQITRPMVDPATGAVVTKTIPVVDTEGSGLMKVATRDWVKWEDVVTNDVMEVARTLGLAASRVCMYAELEKAISCDGQYVDPRHIKQVVNTMSHRGRNVRFTRHGINKTDYSVFQRASYEEQMDMLVQGALASETDDMRGLCECIVFGQRPPIGTGTVGVRVVPVAGAPPMPGLPRPPVTSREQDLLRGNGKKFRPALPGAKPVVRFAAGPQVSDEDLRVLETTFRPHGQPHEDTDVEEGLAALDATFSFQTSVNTHAGSSVRADDDHDHCQDHDDDDDDTMVIIEASGLPLEATLRPPTDPIQQFMPRQPNPALLAAML